MNEQLGPMDMPGHFQGAHANKVHESNANSNHSSPGCSAARIKGDHKSKRTHHDRYYKGRERKQEVVGNRYGRPIGQHSYKMRCPNARAGGKAGPDGPGKLGAANPRLRTLEEHQASETRQHADQCGQEHQTKVVLGCKAGEDLEHMFGVLWTKSGKRLPVLVFP